MKICRLETLKKGVPTIVKFGKEEYTNREDIDLFRCAQMEKNPLTPYRIVEVDGQKETFSKWQTSLSEDENKMLNCNHKLETAVGWASCPLCKWSELTASANMYNIEELNR